MTSWFYDIMSRNRRTPILPDATRALEVLGINEQLLKTARADANLLDNNEETFHWGGGVSTSL